MKEQIMEYASGNEMAAIAIKQIGYDLMGYYPITPSTQIAENLDAMNCYRIEEPFELTVCYKRVESAQLCHFRNPDGSAFGVVDAYTRSGTLARIEDNFLH